MSELEEIFSSSHFLTTKVLRDFGIAVTIISGLEVLSRIHWPDRPLTTLIKTQHKVLVVLIQPGTL